MQDQKPSTICQQSESLSRVYHHLQCAYIELAQTEITWNKDADEYLREESYLDQNAKSYVSSLVEILDEIQRPTQRLALDHQSLCNDLLRVGRGESFSV